MYLSVIVMVIHFARGARRVLLVAAKRWNWQQGLTQLYPAHLPSGFVLQTHFVQLLWIGTTDFAAPCLRARNAQNVAEILLPSLRGKRQLVNWVCKCLN